MTEKAAHVIEEKVHVETPKAHEEKKVHAEAPKVEAKTEAQGAVEHKTEDAKPKTVKGPKILLFNRWDISEVKVEDPGLKAHINLEPIIVPRSYGRNGTAAFRKNNSNIVERFANKLGVSGHKGKKHKMSSGRCVGRVNSIDSSLIEAFEIIERKKKMNPVQVLVKAIENGAMVEEVTAYRVGGTIARKHVVTAPHRRLDVSLRHIAHGIYASTFNTKRKFADVIADELIATADNDPKTMAVRERIRLEKEAEGAR